MRSIETSGKTVEDAVKAGLAELKCDSADVTIDVLEMGSPGLFGMFGKLARVRLTVKEMVDDFAIDFPSMTLEAQKPRSEKKPPEKKPEQKPEPKPAQENRSEPKPAAEAPKAPKAEAPKPEKNPAPEGAAPVIKSVAEFKAARRDQNPPREQREPREPRAPREAREPMKPREPREPREHREPRRRPESAPRDTSPSVLLEELPPLDLSTLGESGKRAYDFLSNVTKLMGVEVDIRIKEDQGHLFAQMSGDALGVLIGRRGETLDALQYLTSLQVNKGLDEYTRVSLDSEHYRAKREDALRKLAARMAARARKTG